MTASGPIAVIGGGFSGAVLTIALLERGAAVILIERSGVFGRGLAYGTKCGRHLLNVRSARMSLRPDQPDHFIRWLAAEGIPSDPDGFARRSDYGRYIQHSLSEAEARAPGRLQRLTGEAVDVRREGRPVVHIGGGAASPQVESVVLALGNPPPAPLPVAGLEAIGVRHIGDPWASGALEGIDPQDDVFLVGTGLTAVDVLLALEAAGWRGRATAVSRRGLLPRPHGLRSAEGAAPTPQGPLSARLAAARKQAADTPWTVVLDRMRPHHQEMWRRAGPAERSRFLRHLRPWWDVHRHRMAPEIGAQVERWISAGRLEVRAGRLAHVEPEESGAVVTWRARGGAEVRTATAWIINCTGPQGDPSRSRVPLLTRLLESGAARVDPFRLGLDTDAEGRIIDGNGRPQTWLSAIGPLTRGALWEIVAVPEIREQAQQMADRLTHRPEPTRRQGAGPLAAFTEHPREQGETYGQHMGVAFRFGFRLLGAGAAACIHGVAPFLFKKTASRTICRLHAELTALRRAPPGS